MGATIVSWFGKKYLFFIKMEMFHQLSSTITIFKVATLQRSKQWKEFETTHTYYSVSFPSLIRWHDHILYFNFVVHPTYKGRNAENGYHFVRSETLSKQYRPKRKTTLIFFSDPIDISFVRLLLLPLCSAGLIVLSSFSVYTALKNNQPSIIYTYIKRKKAVLGCKAKKGRGMRYNLNY